NRAKLTGSTEVRRAAVETPALLYVFDLLGFEGYDVRPLPLVKRKAILHRVLPHAGPLRFLEHFEKDGEALYQQVVKMGLEGIVAKQADSPYRAGRSAHWLKIRADRTDDFVVVGFTRPKGSRDGFGALDLGAYEDGKLVHAGRAGRGFTGGQWTAGRRETRNGKRETRVRPRFPFPLSRFPKSGGRSGFRISTRSSGPTNAIRRAT